MLATGGTDAVINLWHDSTTSEKDEAFRKEEEGVLKGQELENAVSDADYTKAVQIAFELRRPHKLLELFGEISRKRHAEGQIEKAFHALGKEEYRLLLEYVREWNTKPILCHIAQFVLFRVFNMLPPKKIIEIRGIGELLEGLIPYCQRHFSRIDGLERSTFLLDYTLTGMSVIEPEIEEREIEDKSVKHSKDADEEQLAKTAMVEQEQEQDHAEQKEKSSSKKQKSHKSRDVANKKIKGEMWMIELRCEKPWEKKKNQKSFFVEAHVEWFAGEHQWILFIPLFQKAATLLTKFMLEVTV
ncbi:unnamed protein product [Ilex paraguariensis]|uniref:U3 small nucleolar RNA-associated protein 13 C-terminal domain-containing protein n=1 Tax=Ilex paraguariensis TaxID=185542 RepID=A0ABC8R0S5_9AQUA